MNEPQQRVVCPTCGKGYRWQASLVGKRVPCKNCDTPFMVPDAPGVGLVINSIGADGTYDLELDAAKDTPASAEFHAVPANNGKCPSCNSPVREGAMLCMNCGFNMAEGKKIQAPQVTALPEKEKKAMRRELKGMKWVRVGLWLNLASILIMFAILPGTFIAVIYDNDLLYLLVEISSYAFLGLGTLGSLLCLTAPKESGGRPILLISMVLSIGTTLWVLLVNYGPLSDEYHWAIELLSEISTALFLYFFVMLARYLEFDQITERAEKVLGLYILVSLGSYLMLLPFVACVVILFLLAAAIYTLFLYIALLIDLNNALTFHIRDQSV